MNPKLRVGAATGTATAVNTLRSRKIGTLGLLILLEPALSLALLLITGDPRVRLRSRAT